MARMRRLGLAVVAVFLILLVGQYVQDPDVILEIVKHEKVTDLRARVADFSAEAAVRFGDHGSKALELLRAAYLEGHATLKDVQTSQSIAPLRSKFRILTSNIAREVLACSYKLKVWMESEETARLVQKFKEMLQRTQLAEVMEHPLLQHVSGMQLVCALLACTFLALVSRCRRRRVSTPPRQEVAAGPLHNHAEGRAVAAIMKAPTPLRDRQSQPVSVQRRRRSDSPAPVGEENTHSNIAPSSLDEEDLLAHLNSDSAEDLRLLNGFGDKSIDKLIKWRTKYGNLSNVKDLQSKVGIHPATFANFAKLQHLV